LTAIELLQSWIDEEPDIEQLETLNALKILIDEHRTRKLFC